MNLPLITVMILFMVHLLLPVMGQFVDIQVYVHLQYIDTLNGLTCYLIITAYTLLPYFIGTVHILHFLCQRFSIKCNIFSK